MPGRPSICSTGSNRRLSAHLDPAVLTANAALVERAAVGRKIADCSQCHQNQKNSDKIIHRNPQTNTQTAPESAIVLKLGQKLGDFQGIAALIGGNTAVPNWKP